MNTCFTCDYFDGRRCTNRDSDNWNRKVAPTGSCLDYEPEPDPEEGNLDNEPRIV